MKIRVMIAEDERLAREELEFLLHSREDVIICKSVSNGQELLVEYEKHKPDVVFLDIHMPELEGIAVAKILREKERSPLIVFTTAYEEYAVEAFDLHAADYLLKPYDERRLDEALSRIRTALKQTSRSETASVPKPKGKQISKMSKLLLDDGERLLVIDPTSILYMMREDRVVQIFTQDQTFQSKQTLQELEEKLASFHFFRCHRSYLVNLQYIHEIIPWFNGAYNIVLKDQQKTKIPVSRSSVKELFNLLQM